MSSEFPALCNTDGVLGRPSAGIPEGLVAL